MNSIARQASETIILHVDSRYRNKIRNPNSGSFTVDIEPIIHNVSSIRLTSVELPNVFYTFMPEKNNNALYINNQKVDIPKGNYTANKIVCIIQERLDQMFGIQTFLISFSEINGCVTIKNKNGTTFTMSMTSNVTNNQNIHNMAFNESSIIPVPPLLYSLGFRKNQYTGGSTYISESIIDVVGPNYLIMRVNDFGSMRYRQYGIDNAFAKVILCSPKTAVSFDVGSQFFSKQHNFNQPTNLSKLHIELIDPYEHVVDMVHMDYSMTFEIETIRDSFVKKQFEDDRFYGYYNPRT